MLLLSFLALFYVDSYRKRDFLSLLAPALKAVRKNLDEEKRASEGLDHRLVVIRESPYEESDPPFRYTVAYFQDYLFRPGRPEVSFLYTPGLPLSLP